MNLKSLSLGVIILIVVGSLFGCFILTQKKPSPALETKELLLSDYPKVFKENTIIVIGENASQIEKESAQEIAKNLENLTGNKPEIVKDIEMNENLKNSFNIIVVGTPGSNRILGEVIKVSEEYPGEGKGILEIAKNPWNESNALLLVEGSDEWGVKAGALKLGQTYGINETSIIAELEKVEDDYKIFLPSRQFVPSPGISPSTQKKITTSPLERVHVLIQFYHIPNATEREKLENASVELLTYVHNNAWFASISRDSPAKILQFSFVRWIGEILPEDKISPIIRENRIPPEAVNPDGTVNLSIMFFKDVSLDDASQVISKHGGIVQGMAPITNALVVTVPIEKISAIANEDSVQWIDIVQGPPIKFNDGSRAVIGVNTVQAPPYNLDGTGVVVGEWDGGWVDPTHPDLAGRVTIGDLGSTIDDHATHVAGTLLGNGSLSAGRYRGMAPNATVISYEWWDNVSELELEYNDAINNHGIDLSTNSWGFRRAFRSYGGYGEECSALDDVVRGSIGKAIPIVWAAGNNRPSGDNGEYDSISQPGTAKNIITVGAINSDDESMCWFSSWGPTDDGRIKPDVVAAGGETGCAGIVSTIPAGVFTDDFTNGVCPDICEGPGWAIPIAVSDGIDDFFSPYSNSIGPNNWLPACEGIWEGTSMATPAVSGSIALMLQEYRNTHDDIEPLPSTIKALLIHTAQDLGNPGPDYSYGYGRINVPDAVDMIRDDAACCNVIIENNISATGEMDNYTIEVPAGTSELKVTLVWDDYPGTPNAARTLVNDLDLIAIGPTACYYPWILNASDPSAPAFRGRDDINNVEQIVVPNPMPGTWIIRVNGTSVPEPIQNYSLVSSLPMKEEDMTDVEWSIEKGLCWLYHNQNPDGSWTYSGRVTEENVGLTAMATAAFLNYGIDENDPTVRKAIDWILSKQQADGKITNGWYHNYDTSLAVLALVATRNESYYDEIEKAVDFLIELQNDENEGYTQDSPYYGGWPYFEGMEEWWGGWADLSNSQFTMLALHYAEQFNPDDDIVPEDGSANGNLKHFGNRIEKPRHLHKPSRFSIREKRPLYLSN